jgi:hypothetical protein
MDLAGESEASNATLVQHLKVVLCFAALLYAIHVPRVDSSFNDCNIRTMSWATCACCEQPTP